jgi:two-component system, LytTR family, sensor kinase
MRQGAAAPTHKWARIAVVFKRDELGFPSFWLLQVCGWSGLYVLVFAALVSSSRLAELLWANTIWFLCMFATSFLLRPFCRSLMAGFQSWIALEVWGFVCSIFAGALASVVPELLMTIPIDWKDFVETWLNSTVVLFLWCSLYFSIKQWQRSARERERLLRAESEAREARLSALRYQLNPHFLFNSLNAVSTLVLEGNASAATRMLAQIADLLRTTLDSQSLPETPLSQEIAFTEQYLAIEQTRLGNRLRVILDISPDTLDALVPSMFLQPLVENAVRHGVAPLVDGGTIRVLSKLQGSQLRVAVENSGIAGSPQPQSHATTNGIGLKNTAERLKALYGAAHSFVLEWPETGGCYVTVQLPYRKVTPRFEGPACVH